MVSGSVSEEVELSVLDTEGRIRVEAAMVVVFCVERDL